MEHVAWPVTQRSLVQIPLWVLDAVCYVHIYIDPVSSPSCVWIPKQVVEATLQWSGSIQREWLTLIRLAPQQPGKSSSLSGLYGLKITIDKPCQALGINWWEMCSNPPPQLFPSMRLTVISWKSINIH